jgi:DNA-binding IclR family transcriptional regulator
VAVWRAAADALRRWVRPVLRDLVEETSEAPKGANYIELELAKIAEVRDNGFAMRKGEWIEGANAVAVPVADAARNLIGVLSYFGPAGRLSEARLRKIQEILARNAGSVAAAV